MIETFAFLEPLPRWLAWRLESRVKGGIPTKVPYDATRRGPPRYDFGSSTDPKTWGTRSQAETRATDLANGVDNAMTGIGIALGDLGDGTFLAGVNLVSSLERVQGGVPFLITQEMRSALLEFGHTAEDIRNMTPQQAHEIIAESSIPARWADDILAVLPTYTEISPSGNGLKALFLMRAEHVRPFLDLIGVKPNAWGGKRSIPGLSSASHGPGVEIYTAGRFFTITGRLWSLDHQQIATIDWPQLEALAQLIPTSSTLATATNGSTGGDGTANPSSGIDNSRSARALRAVLRVSPDTFEEMVEHLRQNPDERVREWADEVDERQHRRLWERSCAAKAAQRALGLADLDDRIGPVPSSQPANPWGEELWPEPASLLDPIPTPGFPVEFLPGALGPVSK